MRVAPTYPAKICENRCRRRKCRWSEPRAVSVFRLPVFFTGQANSDEHSNGNADEQRNGQKSGYRHGHRHEKELGLDGLGVLENDDEPYDNQYEGCDQFRSCNVKDSFAFTECISGIWSGNDTRKSPG